jgi:hypothetical protein
VRVAGVRYARDLVERDFNPEAPNRLWCADTDPDQAALSSSGTLPAGSSALSVGRDFQFC